MANWFDTARFGMFIHWGISSVGGWELSWPLAGGVAVLPHSDNVSIDDYYACAAKFRPSRFDPRAWARLARRAGMQYGVLTAKHHDGFAMFDTKLSDFSAARLAGIDLVREYAEAFRSEGLRVGLYYSLSDWHHADYPAFREADKPYNFFALPQPTPEQWSRYLEFLFGQVRELLSGYGRIDVIWFDGQWERQPPDLWKPVELRDMIKKLQPEILINDRLPGCGDFDTPEQFVPALPPERAWEVCLTMNETWGYNPRDTAYKSARELVHTLCEVAGRGGNLLLNVSPTADGQLPPEQVDRLEAIAGWMEANGESILGTTPGLEPWQFYGPSTRRGDTFYLHLLMRPYETVSVRGVPIARVRSVRAVASGKALRYRTRCAVIDSIANADPLGELTIAVPKEATDRQATVIAVEMAG